MQDPQQTAAELRAAAQRLDSSAQSAGRGDNVRDELDDVRSSVALTAFRAFGPRPRSKRGEGGKWKLLDYLKAGLGQEFHREELSIIARIDDWARRLRELRVEHGYDVEHLDGDFYVLHSAQPDAAKADEWRTANRIRNLRGASVTQKIEKFLLANVGHKVRRDQLDYVAKGRKEATRRTRELRDEEGWPIVSHIDDPNLRPSEYMLLSADPLDRADPNQRHYPVGVRTKVFKRDGYRCQNCGRTRQDALGEGDTRFILECDHKVGVADPSNLTEQQKSDPDNLQTLCHHCHAQKTGGSQAQQRVRRRKRAGGRPATTRGTKKE